MQVKIGFCTSRSEASRVIRWATHGTVSHAFVVISWFGLDLVIEAVWCGIRLSTLPHLRAGCEVRTLVTLPETAGLQAAVDWAFSCLDEPYAWAKCILGMGYVCVGRRLGYRWTNPVRSPHTLFCSEFCVEVLKRAGWPENIAALDAASEDPEALEELLSAVPGAVVERFGA